MCPNNCWHIILLVLLLDSSAATEGGHWRFGGTFSLTINLGHNSRSSTSSDPLGMPEGELEDAWGGGSQIFTAFVWLLSVSVLWPVTVTYWTVVAITTRSCLPWVLGVHQKVHVMIWGGNLLFSILHLPLLSVESPLTFTILVMFSTDHYQYIIW